MEPGGMPGGMMAGMGSGILGLEMSLHQHPQQQQQQQQQQHHQHQQQMVSFAADHHSNVKQQLPYGYGGIKGKQQQGAALSDEDEPGLADDQASGDTHSGGGGKRVVSPWQRMKWTDSMVRLLIMMVYYVGDDGAGAADADPSGKKKSGSGGGGGMLQKKGKWKSVSRAMMEKGFFVSPQQCEDKFNDLNKRYKRVNDILGKGTACRVVENQSLLETMDHISPKMKEEVRKLLNSKHLFFREMCAYHNCGPAAAAAVAGTSHPEIDSSHQHQQQQRCLHSTTENAAIARKERGREEEEGKEMDEDEEDEDDSEDEDEDDDDEGHGHEDEKGVQLSPMSSSAKRQRSPPPAMSAIQQLNCELMGVLQDGAKSPWEQRQWLRSRMALLEEQLVGFQYRALDLEKQRFKWLKFSGKKEREMEKMKLENERMKLENERMMLLLRQKELELDTNHGKRCDLSSLNV